jgi:hypothetical protein
MKASLILLSAFLALGLSTGTTPTQREIRDENFDSLSRSFQLMTKSLTTAEFERRKQVLRMYQRRGYVDALSDVVADDGLSAILSLLKVNAQIAYHLPHNDLVFYIPVTPSSKPPSTNPWHFLTPASPPFAVPLQQEWTFPDDPWGGQ